MDLLQRLCRNRTGQEGAGGCIPPAEKKDLAKVTFMHQSCPLEVNKIQTFLDKQKWRESITARPHLEES